MPISVFLILMSSLWLDSTSEKNTVSCTEVLVRAYQRWVFILPVNQVFFLSWIAVLSCSQIGQASFWAVSVPSQESKKSETLTLQAFGPIFPFYIWFVPFVYLYQNLSDGFFILCYPICKTAISCVWKLSGLQGSKGHNPRHPVNKVASLN